MIEVIVVLIYLVIWFGPPVLFACVVIGMLLCYPVLAAIEWVIESPLVDWIRYEPEERAKIQLERKRRKLLNGGLGEKTRPTRPKSRYCKSYEEVAELVLDDAAREYGLTKVTKTKPSKAGTAVLGAARQ